jgi:hypothetical protein
MSEERPVPRRESPWGLPEGDKRQPKVHCYNDRAEDVIQVLSLSNHVLFPIVCTLAHGPLLLPLMDHQIVPVESLGIASGWRCIVQ